MPRERQSQRHFERSRTSFNILRAAVPEEGELSPGGAASSTRFSNDEHSDKVKDQHAKRLTRQTKAVGATQDGLSQRRRSYGTKPRDEARDESAVRADDECEGDGDVVGVVTPFRGIAQVVLHGVQVVEVGVVLRVHQDRRSGRRRRKVRSK